MVLLSIIIPVYNSEKYIERCIQSVLGQTIKDFELILVDDGSTDSSYSICQKYETDSRVRIYRKENGGVSSARYYGYRQAQGEWISFIDNDDFVASDMYEYLFSLIADNVDIACISRIDLYNDQIENYQFSKTRETITRYSGKEACEALIRPVDYNLRTPLWGRMYRKGYLKNIDFEKNRISCPMLFMEDVLVTPYVLYHARNVVFSNQVKYVHRELAESISRSGRLSEFYFEQVDSYPIKLNFLKKEGLNDLYCSTLRTYGFCLMRCYYYIKKNPGMYKNQQNWLKKIEENSLKYYQEIMEYEKKLIFRLNYIIYLKCRKIWIIMIAPIYFNVIHKIRKSRNMQKIRKSYVGGGK